MFEKASRLKLRFNYKGVCTVEDLWDIPMTGLDKIFKELNAVSKAHKEESLLDRRTDAERVIDLKIALVKHVFQVRSDENEAKKNAAEKKERKQKLLEIIAKKQDADLEGKSIDDLQKMVDEL